MTRGQKIALFVLALVVVNVVGLLLFDSFMFLFLFIPIPFLFGRKPKG